VIPDHVTLDNWQFGPANRWSFLHLDELITCVPVPRGESVRPLPDGNPLALDDFDEFLTQTYTDGLLVLHDGRIVAERYVGEMAEETRHLLMSVSKSMASVVVGRFVSRGLIEVSRSIGTYLPELEASAYGDATVQQVLDMTVAVGYDETYDDPTSEVATHDRSGGWRTRGDDDPADVRSFLATLRKTGEHGQEFQYCSANTDVLAWLLERVSGDRFTHLLATELWQRLGTQHDAYIAVDSTGFPMASGGVCVTLRDLARFGQCLLDDGRGVDGQQVVPDAWLADIRRGGDPAAAVTSMGAAHEHGSYRDQFWVTGDGHGCFYGVGVNGQYVWVDPSERVVIAKLSTLPESDVESEWVAHVRFFERVCARLR
jgi:CubicO group peptidase (beta-lactamase class C family)